METKLQKPQLQLWSLNCEDCEKPQWNSKIFAGTCAFHIQHTIQLVRFRNVLHIELMLVKVKWTKKGGAKKI